MKRYWKLISLVLFTMIVWTGFFIQSSLAVSHYPEFVLKSKVDDENLGNKLVVTGDYANGIQDMDFLTITEKGSDYAQDTPYFSDTEGPYTDREVIRLKKDHKNFMRGKELEPESFYEDESSLVYANIYSNMNFRGYEAVDHSFNIDILSKETGDRKKFEVKLPREDELLFTQIFKVFMHNNKLQIVASLSFYDNESETDREEMHAYTIDVETEELTGDDIIVTAEGATEQPNEWPSLDVIYNGLSETSQNYVVFMKATQTVTSLPEGEERSSFKDSEFIAYNLENSEQSELELSSDLHPDDFSDTIELEGDLLYFSKVEDNELKMTAYNIPKQKVLSEHSYELPEEATADEIFSAIDKNKVIIVSRRYKEKESDALIYVYDLSSKERIYEGEIEVADNELKTADQILSIYEVTLH